MVQLLRSLGAQGQIMNSKSTGYALTVQMVCFANKLKVSRRPEDSMCI